MKKGTHATSHLGILCCAVAEAVPAVLDAIRATTTADMTADTTEAATIAMMTETTTDHTGEYVSIVFVFPQVIIGLLLTLF